MKNSLLGSYQKQVDKGLIQTDAKQIVVIASLQKLLQNLSDKTKKKSVLKKLFFPPKETTKSIYLFGKVGRGKSMLMDLFFDVCSIELKQQSKRRIHFHAFMQEMHEYIHQWRKKQKGDPLPSLAKEIKNTSSILCFDEFQVTDIADAMLLARLFTYLLDEGVIFVATSNQHPDDLYKNGLQRQLFLPFIEVLKRSSEIIELQSKEDYRLSYFKLIKTTFYMNSQGRADEFLRKRFQELTNNGNVEPIALRIKGRSVDFAQSHGDVLWTSFGELCGRALGSVDYLEIANEFNIILIADIPKFSLEIRDQVRRFVTLIDALYEKKIKIICTVVMPVEQFSFKDKDFDFKRTQSRLIEMQSEKYFNASE